MHNKWQLETAAAGGTNTTVGRGCKWWSKQPIVSTSDPQGYPQTNIVP